MQLAVQAPSCIYYAEKELLLGEQWLSLRSSAEPLEAKSVATLVWFPVVGLGSCGA